MTEQTTNKEQPSIKNKILGYLEMAMGVVIFISPWSVVIAGGVGFSYLTYEEFVNGPRFDSSGQSITFMHRAGNALARAFGTGIGMCTVVGAAVVALVGIKEGLWGNAQGYGAMQGAVVGVVATTAVSIVGVACIAEGAYKAITGRNCNIVGAAFRVVGNAINTVKSWVLTNDTGALVTTAINGAEKIAAKAVHNVNKEAENFQHKAPGVVEAAKKADSFARAANHAVNSLCTTVVSMFSGGAHANTVNQNAIILEQEQQGAKQARCISSNTCDTRREKFFSGAAPQLRAGRDGK